MKRFAAIFFALAFAVLSARAATLTAILDRQSLTVGDSATLQLRFEGGNPQALPAIPASPNLKIEYAGQGREYQNINGRASQALVLSYSVTAMQPGNFVIPPFQANVNGATLQSQPVQVVVAKDAAGSEAGIAFIKLVVAKTNLYVGELIPIEIKVYGPVIDELQIPNLKSDGFTVGMAAPGVRGGESIGGAMYTVYSFHMTVAPAKAGNIILGPAETTLRVRVQTARRRRADLLDEFFGGGFQSKVLSIASETIPLNVMPLPSENVPPAFNGALGNFQIAVSASPTNVAVGDPISLQIQIKGRGSFDTVKLPDFGWKDFTFYAPNAAFTNSDAMALSGIKTFDQVVTPQRAGLTEIPPIKFSFFDPEQRVYRTIQRPGIPITVKATGQGQAQPTVVADQGPQADPQRPATDIVHIKPNPGSLATLAAPAASRPWFLALQLVPLLLWGGAWFWRRREDNLARDPRARRQREVAQRIAEGLPQLRAAAAEKRGDTFFATAFRLLQEQLGERLDVPAAAITEAVVDEQLPKLGASADLLKSLRELFQSCNHARYAGAAAAGLETMLPKIESALNDIQKLPRATGGLK